VRGRSAVLAPGPSPVSPLAGRAALSRTAGEGSASEPELQSILSEMHALGQQRIARESALDGLIGRAVALHPAGFATIDAAAIATVEAELAERLLARVAALIGGARYPARRERVVRLRAGLASASPHARTLGGCRFLPWRGRILVLRELAAAEAPMRIAAGGSLAWDRRFAVTLASRAASMLTVGYLAQSGAAAPAGENTEVPRVVYPVLPAFWDEQGLAAVPHLGYRREGLGPLPCVLFRPANPLTEAGFTVV